MNQTNKNISNFTWLFTTKVLRIIFSLVISIWVARYLGPTDYGLFNYVLSIVMLMSIFASLGLEQIFVKKLIEKKVDKNKLIGTTLLLKLVGSLFIVILALSFALMKNENEVFILLIFFISLSYIFKSFEVITFWFESQQLSKLSSKIDLYAMIISSLFKVGIILLASNIVWFGFSVLLEAILIATGLLIIYMKENSFTAWSFSLPLAKELLSSALPLILAGALYTIYTRIDQIMLGDLVGNTSVGIYVAAVVLSQGWLFIPAIVGKAFYPLMLKSKETSREKYLEITQHLLNIISFISIITSILISFLSYYLISLTFGEKYILSAPILALHVWGGIFTAMSVISYRYFITENLQKTSFYRGLVGLIVNVLLNLILIPLYQGFGAAISTVISLACSLYLFNAFSRSTREMFIMQTKAILMLETIQSIQYLVKSVKGRHKT